MSSVVEFPTPEEHAEATAQRYSTDVLPWLVNDWNELLLATEYLGPVQRSIMDDDGIRYYFPGFRRRERGRVSGRLMEFDFGCFGRIKEAGRTALTALLIAPPDGSKRADWDTVRTAIDPKTRQDGMRREIAAFTMSLTVWGISTNRTLPYRPLMFERPSPIIAVEILDAMQEPGADVSFSAYLALAKHEQHMMDEAVRLFKRSSDEM